MSIIFDAINANDLKLIKSLIGKKGFDINELDTFGNTPLILAIFKKRTEIAKFLINNNANTEIKNKHGQNAIFYSVLTNSTELFYSLINKDNIDLNFKDEFGRTLLSLAQSNKNKIILNYLISYPNTPKTIKHCVSNDHSINPILDIDSKYVTKEHSKDINTIYNTNVSQRPSDNNSDSKIFDNKDILSQAQINSLGSNIENNNTKKCDAINEQSISVNLSNNDLSLHQNSNIISPSETTTINNNLNFDNKDILSQAQINSLGSNIENNNTKKCDAINEQSISVNLSNNDLSLHQNSNIISPSETTVINNITCNDITNQSSTLSATHEKINVEKNIVDEVDIEYRHETLISKPLPKINLIDYQSCPNCKQMIKATYTKCPFCAKEICSDVNHSSEVKISKNKTTFHPFFITFWIIFGCIVVYILWGQSMDVSNKSNNINATSDSQLYTNSRKINYLDKKIINSFNEIVNLVNKRNKIPRIIFGQITQKIDQNTYCGTVDSLSKNIYIGETFIPSIIYTSNTDFKTTRKFALQVIRLPSIDGIDANGFKQKYAVFQEVDEATTNQLYKNAVIIGKIDNEIEEKNYVFNYNLIKEIDDLLSDKNNNDELIDLFNKWKNLTNNRSDNLPITICKDKKTFWDIALKYNNIEMADYFKSIIK